VVQLGAALVVGGEMAQLVPQLPGDHRVRAMELDEVLGGAIAPAGLHTGDQAAPHLGFGRAEVVGRLRTLRDNGNRGDQPFVNGEACNRQILAALAICDRLALLAMFGRHCGFGRATL
jgi:hypothetical protein